MASGSFVTPFLGALQASFAVLLTIFYGVLATQFDLLNDHSAKEISRTCVKLFLPALLIHNLGSNLKLETATEYIPILGWAVTYCIVSMAIGVLATKLFKFPAWATPAIAFNNTTSLPLLLITAMESTGILEALLKGPDDSTSEAVKRAQSYFLVNSLVGNAMTFALGPKLLNASDEDAPDAEEEKDHDGQDEDEAENGDANGEANGNGASHERTSLLPRKMVRTGRNAKNRMTDQYMHYFEKLPGWLQSTLGFLYAFLNAPIIGALIGCVIGLTPPLQRAFFADMNSGGFLNAWLSKSLNNIGSLFAALQVIVVGVKLGSALRKMKRGEKAGNVPWQPVLFITLIRYVFWGAVSIPLFWALAAKTNVLGDDPILWFVLMLSATGPPAMKLTALADVNGSGEEEKMAIAKFLTISYMISPLVCFTVVGSLKAAEAAKG